MYFPISGAHISPIYLAVVGFFIGILGGFFGVGGSFIAGPALRAVGLDWNFAVGTDLAHIVGKSVVAAKRHRALGNVDLKLGLIMAVGTIGGAEVGAQLIQMLKRAVDVGREKSRPIGLRPCHSKHSAVEDFANDHAARFRRHDFTLGHSCRRVH